MRCGRQVGGADTEEVLAFLRSAGCSPIDCIKALRQHEGVALRQHEGVGLAEAKRRVHLSRAWADRRAEYDAFHDRCEEVARQVVDEDRGGG